MKKLIITLLGIVMVMPAAYAGFPGPFDEDLRNDPYSYKNNTYNNYKKQDMVFEKQKESIKTPKKAPIKVHSNPYLKEKYETESIRNLPINNVDNAEYTRLADLRPRPYYYQEGVLDPSVYISDYSYMTGKLDYSCVCPRGQQYFYDYQHNRGYCGTNVICPSGAIPVNNRCPNYVVSNSNRVIYVDGARGSRAVYSYGSGVYNRRPCHTYYSDGIRQTFCSEAASTGRTYYYSNSYDRRTFRPRGAITVYKPADSVVVQGERATCPAGFVYIPSSNMCASPTAPICHGK